MINYTLTEYLVFVALLVVAFLVLRAYIPAWALFASNVGFAVFMIMKILREEETRIMDVVLLIGVVFVATDIWWRELRGTEYRHRAGRKAKDHEP